MDDDTIFERSETTSAAGAAAILLELADGFESGAGLAFGRGEASVATPDELDVDVELEREQRDDGTTSVELEVELAWTEPAADSGEGAAGRASGAERGRERVDAREADATGASGADSRASEGDQDADADDGPVADEEPDVDEEHAGAGPTSDVDATATGFVTADDVGSLARFQVYRDRGDEWRWRLVHRNGNVIADSGEGYSSRSKAEQGLRSVVANAPGADVERL